MKLLEILTKEDLHLNKDGEFTLTKPFSREASIDHFVLNSNIHREGQLTRRVRGVPIVPAIYPNWRRAMTSDEVTSFYNDFKNIKNISAETIHKIVQYTFPRNSTPINVLVTLGTSAPLNNLLLQSISKTHKGFTILTLPKLMYTVKTMVNPERYAKADPATRKMVDTFVKALSLHYGPEEEFPIKVSPDPEKGLPGLQGGARRLLNPRYDISKIKMPSSITQGNYGKPKGRIVILDDILVTGSGIAEVVQAFSKVRVPKSLIEGYVFGITSDFTKKDIDDSED